MNAEEYGVILRYKRQILLQPLVLLLQEAELTALRGVARVVDVTHTYNMYIATIE